MSSEKRFTTFDIVNQHLMVDFEDPDDLPKRKTTFDAAVEQLTVEYPRDKVGATQVMSGTTFRFNGNEWIAQ